MRVTQGAASDLMRDDQLMVRIDSGLHVVADHSGASAAGRHRPGIGIRQRYLLVRCGESIRTSSA